MADNFTEERRKSQALDVKIVILMVALVIFATAGTGYVTYRVFRTEVLQGDGSAVTEAAAGREEVPPLGPTFALGELTVNLSVDPGRFARYLIAEVVLEVDEQGTLQQLKRREVQVRDRVVTTLRSKRIEEISTREGVAQTKEEIAKAVTALLTDGEVVNVYFTRFVTQ